MNEQVIKILKKIKPEVDFSGISNILESGTLTSLDFFKFVDELSSGFDIEIGVEDMLPENFETIDSICEMIKRIKG